MFKKNIQFISLLFLTFNASAEYPKTDSDFVSLPTYCKAKLKPNSPGDAQLWKNKLGHDFTHTHHYCAALHSLKKARSIYQLSADKKEYKRHLLSNAIGDIDYMEDKASPTYILFPHIYTSKAEIYLETNQINKAIAYFNKAINTNRKFTKPYALLSD